VQESVVLTKHSLHLPEDNKTRILGQLLGTSTQQMWCSFSLDMLT